MQVAHPISYLLFHGSEYCFHGSTVLRFLGSTKRVVICQIVWEIEVSPLFSSDARLVHLGPPLPICLPIVHSIKHKLGSTNLPIAGHRFVYTMK